MVARGPRWEAQQAQLQGEKRLTYRSDKPCKRCGTFERRTDNGNCCECDRDVQRPRSKARYHADPVRAIAASVKYRADHLLEVRARISVWGKRKRQTDPQFYLRGQIRKLTNYAFRHGKRRSIIGCTGIEFRQWLAAKFEPGMTLENYGTVWTIDHIKPLTSFDLTDQEQFYTACHYSNTQPIFDNVRKGPPPRTPHDPANGRFVAKDPTR